MLTIAIITKNEEEMISGAIKSSIFADEILVVDTGNTDNTNQISKSLGARIVKSSGKNYSEWRNDALKSIQSKWVMFLDADERISEELQKEIKSLVASDDETFSAYQIPRLNNYLGHFMKYGGWGNEKIIRIFLRSKLIKYVNELHEQPSFEGKLGTLSSPLLHYSHRKIESMLEKTIKFTNYEARLRFEKNHPNIVTWRIIRVMMTEFVQRFVKKLAWMDGTAGIVDGMFQVFNTFIIYTRLWEMQKNAKSTN